MSTSRNSNHHVNFIKQPPTQTQKKTIFLAECVFQCFQKSPKTYNRAWFYDVLTRGSWQEDIFDLQASRWAVRVSCVYNTTELVAQFHIPTFEYCQFHSMHSPSICWIPPKRRPKSKSIKRPSNTGYSCKQQTPGYTDQDYFILNASNFSCRSMALLYLCHSSPFAYIKLLQLL